MSEPVLKCRLCRSPVWVYADEAKPRDLRIRCYCDVPNKSAGMRQAPKQKDRPGNPHPYMDVTLVERGPYLDTRLATGFTWLGESWVDNR